MLLFFFYIIRNALVENKKRQSLSLPSQGIEIVLRRFAFLFVQSRQYLLIANIKSETEKNISSLVVFQPVLQKRMMITTTTMMSSSIPRRIFQRPSFSFAAFCQLYSMLLSSTKDDQKKRKKWTKRNHTKITCLCKL